MYCRLPPAAHRLIPAPLRNLQALAKQGFKPRPRKQAQQAVREGGEEEFDDDDDLAEFADLF